jgi:hypothetical protein
MPVHEVTSGNDDLGEEGQQTYHMPPMPDLCSYKTMYQSRLTSSGRSSKALRVPNPLVPPPTMAIDFRGFTDCGIAMARCNTVNQCRFVNVSVRVLARI